MLLCHVLCLDPSRSLLLGPVAAACSVQAHASGAPSRPIDPGDAGEGGLRPLLSISKFSSGYKVVVPASRASVASVLLLLLLLLSASGLCVSPGLDPTWQQSTSSSLAHREAFVESLPVLPCGLWLVGPVKLLVLLTRASAHHHTFHSSFSPHHSTANHSQLHKSPPRLHFLIQIHPPPTMVFLLETTTANALGAEPLATAKLAF